MRIHIARRHGHAGLVMAAGVLALAGGGLLTAGVIAQVPAPPTTGVAAPVLDPRPPGVDPIEPLDPSPPVSVSIPAIGVDAPTTRLRLQADNTMEVPADPAHTGWYEGSAAPGALGPTVVAGHVTWNQEPTVFFELGALRPGEEIHIRRKDGRTAIYAVTDIAQYGKDDFPTSKVYGDVDQPEIRLITCAGPYDPDTNEYDSNLVVFGELVATT